MKIRVDEVVAATGGRLVRGDGDAVVSSFANDSRNARSGSCFVAIEADRDGHAFLGNAAAAGAVCALVQRAAAVGPDAPANVIVVEDTLTALAAVAAHARRVHLAAATVVGVTGSTGKTSTKDLLVGALSGARRVHANLESFNNEIGLPTTILDAPSDTEVLVAEMGARFAGNIRDLCEIASPQVGIITNIGTAHAEHLGGVDGILRVKGELVEALPATGLAVVPSDEFGRALVQRTAAGVLRVGTSNDADVRVRVIAVDDDLHALVAIDAPWGRIEARLGLRGEHQAVNAAMAAAAAHHCGAPADVIAAGLAAAHGSKWRMELVRTASGLAVLNDAYNANPTSVLAALDSLAALPVAGKRIAVLGTMRELGAESDDAHALVGRHAAAVGIDVLIGVGVEGRKITEAARGVATVGTVPDADAALTALRDLVGPDDAVLVKASRAVGLERVAAALVEEGAA